MEWCIGTGAAPIGTRDTQTHTHIQATARASKVKVQTCCKSCVRALSSAADQKRTPRQRQNTN